MTRLAIELSYAVRPRIVGKYFGQLCLALAALTVPPAVVALGFADIEMALRCALVAAGLILLGAPLAQLRIAEDIQVNEAMVLVALIFAFASLAMSWPLMAAGLPFPDAFFEAVSGVTTTGLTTLATVEDKPGSFLFLRAWMQWYGGLGFVVLFLALITRPGPAAIRLGGAAELEEDLVGGTKAHARLVLAVYLLLTLAGTICLWPLEGSLFPALLHTLTSVSTGGFAPHDRSLAGFDLPLQWAITFFFFLGAVPLAAGHRLLRGRWQHFLGDLQLQALAAFCLGATLLLIVTMRLALAAPWEEVLRHAPLLAFSAQTTTGFSSLDPGQLDAGSKIVLILAMAMGGGLGSTAGGVKVLRLLILLRLLHLTLIRTCLPPHAVLQPTLEGRRLEETEIREAFGIIVLFTAAVAASWLAFAAAGFDPLDALFDVVSATGTVGLSTGVTGPDLSLPLKGVLCADMLLGRLEIFAWLVVLFPRTWLGKRKESA